MNDISRRIVFPPTRDYLRHLSEHRPLHSHPSVPARVFTSVWALVLTSRVSCPQLGPYKREQGKAMQSRGQKKIVLTCIDSGE